ncbi:Gfo/Idh/MocA family oxidoreductase [Segetibacter sp.]|uniref:Gfo/Idh/MocA family protein n=1 Tax=Segetibacter sp. TaxID=2231182 RepID=UPI002625C48B|nr:Gfo/Idh/MocA family oxidoreductase [Segetibacter sp.]MCW3081059.1 oxidoreductase domain protein [Segetibacter sp.]
MKAKQYGFGIIGAGIISDIHARAINAIENAKLVGVFSINKNKSQAWAYKNNCTSYDSLDEMVNNPEIDIVCICTPSGIHFEPAIKCIEAGKHCVIEKPLEVTLEKCDRIIEASDRAGVKTAVIFPSRFYEASKQVKKAIDENRFGNMVLGDAYVKWSRSEAYYNSAAWRGTWELDGGGALMNQGIHSVDLLQWYMGRVESVQAMSANVKHKGIEVEDTVVSTLKFANGALGTIECSTAVFPGTFKRVEIMGTSGTAILEESSLIKWQFEKEASEDETILKNMSTGNLSHGGVSNPADISFAGHQRQLEDMILSIETGKKPLIDAIDGRKSVEIVLAIYESCRTGRRVALPGL